MAILGSFALLNCISSADGKDIVFETCEATDARHLLKKSSETSWRSEWQKLGDWYFASEARISCKTASCVVSTRLSYHSATSPSTTSSDGLASLDPILPHHERDGTERVIFTHETAGSLRDGIDQRPYRTSSTDIETVWVDYGTLAEWIKVRSRTAISCRTDRNHCTIDSNIIAFISYDEHHECGYLGRPDNSSYFIY